MSLLANGVKFGKKVGINNIICIKDYYVRKVEAFKLLYGILKRFSFRTLFKDWLQKLKWLRSEPFVGGRLHVVGNNYQMI